MKLQVWTAGGRLAYRSPDAPPWPLVRGGEGLRDITLNGESLRAFVRWSADRQFRVEVAQAPDLREQYALAMSLLVAGAMLLGLGGFLWRLAATLRHALAPLDETARELASRTARDLHPVPLDGHPIELHAVIRAFNQMLARVRRALLHEQRFTADAAHELKTPLASLKVLLHNARQAPDEAARHDALEAMGGVVEQAGHLVDQLLALARYDQAPEQVDMTERVDLLALARQVAAPLLPIARSRGGVELLVEQTGSACTVRGNREALASLLRNLLDNAIRHARGAVHVVLCGEGPTVRVEVHDDGPGIPQAWRGRVVSRFVRVPGGATTGTGLGLAICERVAELHQGRLRLEASPRTGGALACVELRAA
jgi:signal transduction histidine kinase